MKALHALGVATLCGLSSVAWAGEINVHGAILPSDCQKVGENRYRTSEDWEGVKKFYKSTYPERQFPRKPIVNQPGVKAEHISNPGGKTFEGLNIYQANDEVRIYIVPTDPKPKKRPEQKPKK